MKSGDKKRGKSNKEAARGFFSDENRANYGATPSLKSVSVGSAHTAANAGEKGKAADPGSKKVTVFNASVEDLGKFMLVSSSAVLYTLSHEIKKIVPSNSRESGQAKDERRPFARESDASKQAQAHQVLVQKVAKCEDEIASLLKRVRSAGDPRRVFKVPGGVIQKLQVKLATALSKKEGLDMQLAAITTGELPTFEEAAGADAETSRDFAEEASPSNAVDSLCEVETRVTEEDISELVRGRLESFDSISDREELSEESASSVGRSKSSIFTPASTSDAEEDKPCKDGLLIGNLLDL